MATQASAAELIAALGRADGKGEIVDGEIVVMSPAGYAHNRAAGNIYLSLRQYERETRRGRTLSDNAGFVVDLPHRKSFSPDAAFYVGAAPGPASSGGTPLASGRARDSGRSESHLHSPPRPFPRLSPAGYAHNRAAGNIYLSLRQYERETRRGRTLSDNAGFVVDLPHRKSFSPDAAFYVGAALGPGFLQGAPLFAVEVRSPDDYGPEAENAMAAKRADYFAAGTAVVWDVDVLREARIAVYRAAAPELPTLYRRGEAADAERAAADAEPARAARLDLCGRRSLRLAGRPISLTAPYPSGTLSVPVERRVAQW